MLHFWCLWAGPQTARSPRWTNRLQLHCLRKARHLWLWIHFLPSSEIRHSYSPDKAFSSVGGQMRSLPHQSQDLKSKSKKERKKERADSQSDKWLVITEKHHLVCLFTSWINVIVIVVKCHFFCLFVQLRDSRETLTPTRELLSHRHDSTIKWSPHRTWHSQSARLACNVTVRYTKLA